MTTARIRPEVSNILVPDSRLAWEWTRFEMASWLREPAAVVLNMAYPLIMLGFFLVSTDIRTDSAAAISLLGYLSLVGVLMVCLNFPANGIPEARESDFYAFSRTLPIGAAPRLIAWTAAPIACGLISAASTFIIATLVSAAEPSVMDFAIIIGVSLVLAVPITLLGLALGFILPKKTSLAVSLTIAFSMILFGGISGIPLPSIVETISHTLPSGAAGHIIASHLNASDFDWRNIVVLIAWTVIGILAVFLLYRRDEGRRFR